MRKILYIVIFILFFGGTDALCSPLNFKWQSPKDEIMKKHTLKKIRVQSLEQNIISLLTIFESNKFEVFFLDSEESYEFCGIKVSCYLTFYENRLVYIFLETDELLYEENHDQGRCATKEIFSGKIPLSWSNFSKNIHLEPGIYGMAEDKNNYFVEQRMFGENGLSDPRYLQYVYYLFDRKFIDREITFKLNIYSPSAKPKHITNIFTLTPNDM